MIEQFKMKRIWEDDFATEVMMTLTGKWCEVTVNEYVTASDINAFISSIQAFNARNGESSERWILDLPLVRVSLTFALANVRGIVQVNVVVEQSKGDGGDMKAALSFETTMGQLDDLSVQLKRFINRQIDHVASLRPE
ncbi:hypothetical protein ACFQO8_11030 [Exiguobacterium aestuarii]|uniref:COMM domain-containing protein n=1 Tax=Exiguobacterium aestuarii TaxID=273527 RepID=A0ABW2PSK0_9BACL|nr:MULTISPECIES: hypothetical protein [Exiguobacterium]MCT4785157.1 hypothetical protein [Exiguobacterium aestuarii]